MMRNIQFAFFFLFLLLSVNARFNRIGYVSDPVELLLKDSLSSLRLKNVQNYADTERRQIRKRKFTVFPPTFYSNFGFGPMPFGRRQLSLPYTDLLFSGR
ncbi:unnamed protein product [Auanema sp. JU1783]|nr:unnamed protein product [Auanema sp. JU1783]